MIDHIGLFVADAAKRADFYEKLLAPQGYVKKAAYPTAVCFANDEDGDGIWLESPKDGNPVVPSHVAFRAKTADAIKAFHEAGLAPAAPTTASPVRARTTGRATMPRSSMIRWQQHRGHAQRLSGVIRRFRPESCLSMVADAPARASMKSSTALHR